MSKIVCRSKILTPPQAAIALRRSIEVNPRNADEQRIIERTEVGRRGGPRRLALVIGRRWPVTGVQLSVRFLDGASKELRSRILLHMNAWSKTANVRFVETAGTGQVRIARLDHPTDMAGYWSYVGTEILGIEDDQPTLNLEGFTMRTPDAEFTRVVRHEAGHTLGFDHEHMRADLVRKIDRRKAIVYYDRHEGWTEAETIEQVLTPLARTSIMGTAESDPHSIMCYQIPAEITKDGKAIPGGIDITANDFAFAAKVYPIARRSAEAGVAAVVDRAPAPRLTEAPAPPEAAIDSDTFHLVILDRFQHDDPAATRTAAQQKFVRVLATYGGARVTVPMRVHADEGEPPTRFGAIIATHERIKNYTNRDSGSLPDDERMIAFGSDLFEKLFQGDVRRLYDEARSRQHGRKLDLVLTSMVPWIAEKPWEFAYDASRRSFLATEEIHFIRNVLTGVPADVIPPRRGPLRILVVSAQPAGYGQLSIEQETEVIRRGFDALIDAGLAEVEVLARATPGAIHERLAMGAFEIVHFIGHGVFDEDTQQGALVFEDVRGGASRLGERSVREIFCQRGVKLVFLNACQSGSGGRADFNKGVAQSLVAHGLPALVANQYSVLDTSATQFAQHFYWALAQGMSIGRATREARIAVNYSLQGESIDWAIPVVYARDPSMALTTRTADVLAAPPVNAALAKGRRAGAGRPFEMAVWDIDSVFPSLDGVLARMNAAQDHFDLARVDLSTPIDAWDLEHRSPDGTPYLWAERLATRLGRMPLELHVNALVCITRHWLRDDNDLNIYGWWPDRKGPPVLIFSCAGFDGLAPAGPDTERVIANVLVTGLAGYLGEMGTHDRGPQDCPMARNAQRNLKRLASPQKFDRRCRARLLAKLPRALPALEALGKAFR